MKTSKNTNVTYTLSNKDMLKLNRIMTKNVDGEKLRRSAYTAIAKTVDKEILKDITSSI